MPFRILRTIAQRREGGKVGNPAGCLEDFDSARGTNRFLRPFLPFFPNAFPGKLGEGATNRTTERDGFGIHSKIEAGGELKPAEDAERILAEGGTDVTKQAALEIATACMRI